MKLVKILSALAVIAAAGMVAAGCNTVAGNGDETAFTETAAPESTGGITAGAVARTKTIKVKFRVLNGGYGLVKSEGIIATQDNSHLIYGGGRCANDYTLVIIAPVRDEYLNVYWKSEDWMYAGLPFYVSARMKPESGTITFNYNGRDPANSSEALVATENLYDVCFDISGHYSFEELKNLAGINEFEGGRKIKVKFEVKNGGWGLWWSEGIVSTQDDSYLEYAKASCANDFTITLPVPQDDEYLNIRWWAMAYLDEGTLIKAKMKAESGTITLDYNGRGKVATKNLYDVRVDRVWDYDKMGKTDLHRDWEDAEKRAVNDDGTAR